MKPLLKWPGGKAREISEVYGMIPDFDRYIEPFFGGGAMFFHLKPERSAINDTAADLMEFYHLVQVQDEEFKKAYRIVQNACVIGQRYIRKGVLGSDADTEIRNYIEENGYRNYFRHSLGHGIGIGLFEGPYLSQDSKDVLAAGHVVTMEPGIYIPGRFGIRIEDLLYISNLGTENLTRTTRELIEL